jgi:hypothetical protein
MPTHYLRTVALAALAVLAAACDQNRSTGPETEAPQVVSVTPAPGAAEVPTNATVTVTFSEPIDPVSVTVLVNGLVRGPVSVADSVVTLTLGNRLFQKVPYTAAVPAGVRDLAGNTMDSAYVWTFTTGFAPLGEDWTQETSPTTAQLNAIARGSQEFLAVGEGGTMLSSPDGLAWAPLAFQPQAPSLNGAFPVGDRYVVAASPGSLVASTDAFNWTEDRLPDSIATLNDVWVAFDGIYMVGTGGASGTDGIVVKYQTPTSWSSTTLGANLTPRSITGYPDGFVVAGDSGLIFTSTDGATWTNHSLGKTWAVLHRVRYDGHSGLLIAVGSAVITSPDGIGWTERTPKSSQPLHDVSWTTLTVGAETYALYCAVGHGGRIITSPDLINWTEQTSGVTADLRGIARGLTPTRFVVVGTGGVILTSE